MPDLPHPASGRLGRRVTAGGWALFNPWGNCASDPNGEQWVGNGTTFTVYGGASVNYASGVANPFGSYSSRRTP